MESSRSPSESSGVSNTYRTASVYDVVAGRMATKSFRKGNAERHYAGVTPDEVLFRHPKAPNRYAEDDFYWADRHLPPGEELPDSDLLKAIHAYAADYYARAFADKGQMDQCSMDGTALLAFGILLEEVATQVLGETGDLALIGARGPTPEPHAESDSSQSSDWSSDKSSEGAGEPASKRPRLDDADSGHWVSPEGKPSQIWSVERNVDSFH